MSLSADTNNSTNAVPLAITSGKNDSIKSHVLVDALPYYDKGYEEPGVREHALNLIEEETRHYRPTKNYLAHLPPPDINAFLSPLMKTEFERIQQRLPMEMFSMKRYELPGPPQGKSTDLAAWNEALDNSFAQLEHQSLRIENLVIMQEYGGHMWRSYVDTLSRMAVRIQKELQDIKKQIQELNWSRKNEQLDTGEQLRALEEQWVGLISKNYEIERACADLEHDISQAKQKENTKP